jgi:hypothetical protein
MWSAGVGMLLILMGLAVALGPILYGFHLEVVERRSREFRSNSQPMSIISALRCAHCGELVEDTYFAFAPHDLAYDPSDLYEAS